MARIGTKEAAEILGVSAQTVRAYHDEGWLVGRTASGDEGRGKRIYFDDGEVKAFLKGGAPAAKAYRESNEPKPAPRRGRKVGAA